MYAALSKSTLLPYTQSHREFDQVFRLCYMMQELLGGERKICMSNEGFVETTRPPSAPDQTQNLRCPRCDSTNTKFCYYNNYNLTQPRHFCKTCRRYWTKGGALRNVPIGGGCRKNKPSTTTISPSASSRLKSSFSISEIGKQIFLGTGFDHDLPPSTSSLLWSPPQNSHILGLLSMPLSTPINGAQVVLSDNNRSLLNQTPTIWRSNQQPNGEPQNSGIQELLQKLKTTTGGYYGNPQGTNAISSTNPSGIILESAPVSGPDFSYFTPPFSWSDVATPTPLRQ